MVILVKDGLAMRLTFLKNRLARAAVVLAWTPVCVETALMASARVRLSFFRAAASTVTVAVPIAPLTCRSTVSG